MRELRELFRATGGRLKFAVLLSLRCPFDTLNTVLLASFLQYGFQAIAQKSASGLSLACLAFALASMLLFLYNGTVWTQYAAYSARLTAKLRLRLFEKVSGLSLRQVEGKPAAEWFTRLNSDVQAAITLLSAPLHLPHMASSVICIAVSSAVLASLHPAVFLLVLAFVVPHMLVSQLFIAKPMAALAADAQRATSQNTADLDAVVTCADTALLYDAQGFLMKRFEESSLALRRANMRMRRRNAAGSALLPLMGMSGYLLILLLGGVWIAGGTMTFGELTAAFQYRGGVLLGFMMLINSSVNIRAALAGVRRVNETMQVQAED